MTLKDCRYAPGTDNTQVNADPVKYEYEWDWRDRLVEAKVYKGAPGSHVFTIRFGYDGTGRRIWREKLAADGTRLDLEKYIYDGANVLQDYDADNNVKARYVMNGVDNIYYVLRGGKKYFYHTNHLGSVVAITDEAGDVVNRYEYTDSWGDFKLSCPSQATKGKPCIPNRYIFTSREWDEDLGMYYYRARWYDSKIELFISEDPLHHLPGLQRNNPAYLYALNNPINGTDATGLAVVTNSSNTSIYIKQEHGGPMELKPGESAEADGIYQTGIDKPGFKGAPPDGYVYKVTTPGTAEVKSCGSELCINRNPTGALVDKARDGGWKDEEWNDNEDWGTPEDDPSWSKVQSCEMKRGK